MKMDLEGGKRKEEGELPGPGEAVTSKKSKDLIYTAADALNHA